jgi:hypothetical protein
VFGGVVLVDVRVEAVPHDLLKVRYWTKHGNVELLPDFLRGSRVWNAVKDHHRERWRSDVLSAAVARQFFDGDEYVTGDLESGVHYFIPVYETQNCIDGLIELPLSYREKLHEQIMRIYNEEYERGGNWEIRANERVNKLLLFFPADTWTPFVSLAAHHLMTWILHLQGEGTLKSAARNEGGLWKTELCILMFRIPETEFHKLKEIRRFYVNREDTLRKLESLLYHNLQGNYGVGLVSVRVGDELVTVTVDRNIKGTRFN